MKAAQPSLKTNPSRLLSNGRLARSGSSDVSLRLFLNGHDQTAGGSTSLLYQLGTVSRLADQASSLFAQATEQKNVAAALSGQAEAAKKEGVSLMRQAGAAERAGDATRAAALREQGRIKLMAARLAPEDAARLHLLRNLSGAVNRTREQLRDGLIDQAEADSRIRNYVGWATRRPKAAGAGSGGAADPWDALIEAPAAAH